MMASTNAFSFFFHTDRACSHYEWRSAVKSDSFGHLVRSVRECYHATATAGTGEFGTVRIIHGCRHELVKFVARNTQNGKQFVSHRQTVSVFMSEEVKITYAPPDMWSRQKDTGKTMAEVFMLHDVPIVKASRSRVQGWLQVKEMFAPMDDGLPKLRVFNTCREFIDDIQAIQADDKNPNDCAVEPHDITHICDACRYFCMA